MSRNHKTFFVVNPVSGGGRGKRLWEEAEHLLKKRFGRYEFEYTNSHGHGIVLASEALKSGYEMVVAVGGDGTANEVVNGFFEEGEPLVDGAILGILSAGTGGDYPRCLKFPLQLEERIERLAGAATRTVDIGHVDYRSLDGLAMHRYFINVAGCGLPGELVDEITKMPRTYGGTVAYLLGLAKALFRHRNQEVTLTIDDSNPIRRKVLCAVIANGEYFGSGMHIAPSAVIDDGWFDLVVVGDATIADLLRHLPQLYWGNIRKHPKVEVYRARHIKITAPVPLLLDLDGEQQGTLPATYRILPKALRVKV